MWLAGSAAAHTGVEAAGWDGAGSSGGASSATGSVGVPSFGSWASDDGMIELRRVRASEPALVRALKT
jgi:hypothetical protein